MKLLTHPLLGVALFVLGATTAGTALAQKATQNQDGKGLFVGTSYQNDVSLPLYYLPAWNGERHGEGEEGPENPKVPSHHVDSQDPVIQNTMAPVQQMPLPILSFDGIPFPGVGCNCAPPDTDGEVGATQYVQMVNEGFQVFNKTTGASIAGPTSISALWAGFGGVCESNGHGDPVVLYDQFAQRWLISQFASATSNVTDECIAVSQTSDATGSYYRYGFHLGSNFYDYPHLGVWPDGYYMSMNVFNASGTAYLGPQPFVFDRNAMLAGNPTTFISTGLLTASDAPLLPSDADGLIPPPLNAPNPFVMFPDSGAYKVYRFHADFVTPANSTFTLAGSPAAAGFTSLCPGTRACVPQLGGTGANSLDGIGDRLMFRLAYRNFGSHESLVGNFTVSAGGVAGVRWFELRNGTTGSPSVFQESTYQPDTTWRWMGSAAMDTQGNLAVGFSASSASINPQLRYAGRLVGDPAGTLAQGESHLFDGTGSQTGTGNRWGDYSDLTVDPVDDCTFWYTNEYYSSNGSFNWRTRIGNFKFPGCSLQPGFTLAATPPAASVCAGTPANFSIDVGSTAGFNSPVTLSASGNPSPSTVTFTPTVVPTLPGVSAMQVGNTTGVAAGTYPIQVNGTASGASNQSTSVDLSVFTVAPGAPTLQLPVNGATSVSGTPTFTWTGSNSETYLVEVATDPGFGTIVFSQSVTGTTVTPGVSLAPNTLHYWRVTPANACGTGTTSAVFTFTTVNEICSSPGIAIPDSNPTGASDSIVLADPSVLTGLKVKIAATHTWVGDLSFTLSNGSGSVIMIDRPGVPASSFGCSGDNIDVTMDDASGTPVETQCNASPPALSGDDQPNNPINPVFVGQSLAGTWTITAVDAAGGDTGTLDTWCLVPETAAGATFTVGGNVSGLAGSGLVINLNGTEDLPLIGNGVYTFSTALADGSPYAVTVTTQPTSPDQTCTVSNGSGTISGANVTNVDVTCVTNPPSYTVGGNVSGLVGSGLVLQVNGGDDLAIATDGPFTFPTPIADGSVYAVTVTTQPADPAQFCTVSNANGTISGADVTDVMVACGLDTIFKDGFESAGPPSQPVQDPSFEATTADGGSNPFWSSLDSNPSAGGGTSFYSDGFGIPIHTGTWAVWFGGWGGGAETQDFSQSVTFPNAGPQFLNYWRFAADLPDAPGTMTVTVDSNVVETTDLSAISADSDYTQRSIDVSAYADGAAHTIQFQYVYDDAGATGIDGNIFIDDVTVDPTSASTQRAGRPPMHPRANLRKHAR